MAHINDFEDAFARHFNCRAISGLQRALILNSKKINFEDAINAMTAFSDPVRWFKSEFDEDECHIEFEQLEPLSELEQSLLDQYRSNPTISEARVNLNTTSPDEGFEIVETENPF